MSWATALEAQGKKALGASELSRILCREVFGNSDSCQDEAACLSYGVTQHLAQGTV